jgi:hypothetical protein
MKATRQSRNGVNKLSAKVSKPCRRLRKLATNPSLKPHPRYGVSVQKRLSAARDRGKCLALRGKSRDKLRAN